MRSEHAAHPVLQLGPAQRLPRASRPWRPELKPLKARSSNARSFRRRAERGAGARDHVLGLEPARLVAAAVPDSQRRRRKPSTASSSSRHRPARFAERDGEPAETDLQRMPRGAAPPRGGDPPPPPGSARAASRSSRASPVELARALRRAAASALLRAGEGAPCPSKLSSPSSRRRSMGDRRRHSRPGRRNPR